MQPPSKSQFLHIYGFPSEWDAWGLYPDELFNAQLNVMADDVHTHHDEHLRYGAFIWWVQKQRDLPKDTLLQLCRLAALDPDPPMAGAAIHDILFHPMADSEVVTVVAELARNHAGWVTWHSEVGKRELFSNILNEGRVLWATRVSRSAGCQ